MEEVVEERQQGEGVSASETLENVGSVKRHDIQSGSSHYFMKEEDEEKKDEPLRSGCQLDLKVGDDIEW